MHRRLNILKYWFTGNKHNTNFFRLMREIGTSSIGKRAKLYIEKIESEETFRKVYFKNIFHPLYFPLEIPLNFLYQIVPEQFQSIEWHYYQIPETAVTSSDIVVDCGAAEGLFSLLVAQKCKKIYSIEPLPRFIEGLHRTFSKHNNIEIIDVALSNRIGTGKLSQSNLSSSLVENDDTAIMVKTETIDNLFFFKNIPITYIKADLEGNEMKMLEGAIHTIQHYKPKIAITTYHNKDDADNISSFLRKNNPEYKIITKGIDGIHGGPVMLHAY